MPIIIIWIAVMCSIFLFPALLLKLYEFCREMLYDYRYEKMKEESYERERMEPVPDQEVGSRYDPNHLGPQWNDIGSRLGSNNGRPDYSDNGRNWNDVYDENGNRRDAGKDNKEKEINESRCDEADFDGDLKF